MNPPDSGILDEVRHLLLEGDWDRAAVALLDLMYAPEALAEWARIARLRDARQKLHHSLSFVSGFRFSDEPTASIDTSTAVLTFGAGFFLNQIDRFSDLLFVLLHERGHVLISFAYGSRMKEFSSFSFANLWEDIYINNTILILMESDLCKRIYADAPSNIQDLLCQEFSRWFLLNEEFLRFRVGSFYFELLRRAALQEFFASCITYDDWMSIGLILEPSYSSMVDDFKGDFLADMAAGGGDFCGATSKGTATDDGDGVGKGTAITHRRTTSYDDLPEAVKKAITSLHPEEVAPAYSWVIAESNFRSELEDVIVSALVGEILSRQNDEVYFEGKTGVLSNLTRRDVVQLASDLDPVLWVLELSTAKNRLKLYMDVSGSMTVYYPVVELIHKYLGEHVDRHFQFSTVVVEVTSRIKGIATTGGTSYQAVGEHIVENGFTDVIVVTDNTDTIPSRLLSKLQGQLTSLYLLQTRPGKSSGFSQLASKVIDLPGRVNVKSS